VSFDPTPSTWWTQYVSSENYLWYTYETEIRSRWKTVIWDQNMFMHLFKIT
jgi:hypothetical protein